MQDQAAGGAQTFGLLELVGPAAVVGHVLALEQGRIVEAGIVDHGDDDLALDVHAFEVIPAEFGRVDAEAAEDEFRVGNFDLAGGAGRPDHEVFGLAQVGLLLGTLDPPFAFSQAGDGSDGVHFLEIAVTERGLQPQRLHLAGQVLDGLVFIRSHRHPAAEVIGAEGRDPVAHQGLLFGRRDRFVLPREREGGKQGG